MYCSTSSDKYWPCCSNNLLRQNDSGEILSVSCLELRRQAAIPALVLIPPRALVLSFMFRFKCFVACFPYMCGFLKSCFKPVCYDKLIYRRKP